MQTFVDICCVILMLQLAGVWPPVLTSGQNGSLIDDEINSSSNLTNGTNVEAKKVVKFAPRNLEETIPKSPDKRSEFNSEKKPEIKERSREFGINIQKRKAQTHLSLRETLGVSEIWHITEGTICSGIHLKPWILITAASCLNGRNKKQLVVRVTTENHENNSYESISSKIVEFVLHPEFYSGKFQQNLAVVKISGENLPVGHEYHIPDPDVTAEDIIRKNVRTFTNVLRESNAEYSRIIVAPRITTMDYRDCGTWNPIPKTFCSKPMSGAEVFDKVQVGRPLFFHDGKFRRVLGLFVGNFLGMKMKGHLFFSLSPNRDWIQNEITRLSIQTFT